jgi:hypothetical protein
MIGFIFVGADQRRRGELLAAGRPETNFRAFEPGELFLFKLHSPRNFIGGDFRIIEGGKI